MTGTHSKKDKPKKWTVMLYVAALVDDEPQRAEETERAAIRDIEELQSVGSTATVNVILQIDRRWPGYGERYYVRKGGSETLDPFPNPKALHAYFDSGDPYVFDKIYPKFSEGSSDRLCEHFGIDRDKLSKRFKDRDPAVLRKLLSSGNPGVLREFVRWAQDQFRADRYLLVLWGHAYGLGFGRDHHDPLTIAELARALEDRRIDILGTNACAMSYAEAAFELAQDNAAKFMVAPEITMPFQGWPYDNILNEIVNNPDIEPKELGERIIDYFMESFGGKDVALTLLDLQNKKLNEQLKVKVRKLAKTLAAAIQAHKETLILGPSRRSGPTVSNKSLDEEIDRNGPPNQIDETVKHLATELKKRSLSAKGQADPEIKSLELAFNEAVRERTATQIPEGFLDTAHGEVRPLIDLADLCEKLTDSRDKDIKAAADDLRDLLKPGNGLIVKHEADKQLDGLNGLGIYAPSITTVADLKRLELDDQDSYRKLKLISGTAWGKLVYTDLQGLLKRENDKVAAFVSSTGVNGREDTAAIGQLTVSIFRSFDKLEQALKNTELTVKPALEGIPYDLGPTARQRLIARLSPPFVRLAEALRQPQDARAPSLIAYPQSEIMPEEPIDEQVRKLFDDITASLRELENALGDAEKTATKALTHARFGVGEPPKTGEGEPPKTGEGEPPKTGEGEPPKTGEGIFPLFVASGIDGGDIGAASETRNVAALYEQVARSFQRLENAGEKLENVLRAVLTDPAVGVDGKDDDEVKEYRTYATEQVQQSFRELEEMLAYARQTTFEVTMHPVYGLGPGREPGLGAAGRQRLAVAAGLSPRSLRLL